MPSAAPKKLFLISLAAVVAVVRGDGDCKCSTSVNFPAVYQGPASSKSECASLYPACQACAGGNGICSYTAAASNSAAICFAPSDTCACLGGDAAGLCILTWVAILVIVVVIAIPICCFCGLCVACGYTAGGCCKQDRYGAPYAQPDPEFGGQPGVYGRAPR